MYSMLPAARRVNERTNERTNDCSDPGWPAGLEPGSCDDVKGWVLSLGGRRRTKARRRLQLHD